MALPTVDGLRKLEGQGIAKLCDGGYTDAGFNHCAHFVSHALGYSFGFTCKGMTGKGSSPSTIRVHELFARCPQVGKWADFKGMSCLVFVTDAGNVDLKKKVMSKGECRAGPDALVGWLRPPRRTSRPRRTRCSASSSRMPTSRSRFTPPAPASGPVPPTTPLATTSRAF